MLVPGTQCVQGDLSALPPGACHQTQGEGRDLYPSPTGYRVGLSDGALVLSAPPHCLAPTQMVTLTTSKRMMGPVSVAQRAVRGAF